MLKNGYLEKVCRYVAQGSSRLINANVRYCQPSGNRESSSDSSDYSRAAAARTATMTPTDDQDFVDAAPVASAIAGEVKVADGILVGSALDAGAVSKSEYFGDGWPVEDGA